MVTSEDFEAATDELSGVKGAVENVRGYAVLTEFLLPLPSNASY